MARAAMVAAALALTLSGACAAAGGAATHRAPPVTFAQCTATWTSPETLTTAAGVPVHVDQLVAPATLGTSLLLVGSPAYAWNTSSQPRDAMGRADGDLLGVSIGQDLKVSEVRKPAFMKRTSAVWTLPAAGGGLHVVWGVPADTGKPPFRQVPSVWYARLDNAGWTAPELVMSSEFIDWRWSASVATIGDDVIVAAPAGDGGWRGVIAARRVRGAWNVSKLPPAGYPAPSVVLAATDAGAVLFYPGLGAADRIGTAALYARQLSRSGGDWSDATLVRSLEPGPNWPHLAAAAVPDGTIHLFWRYRRDGDATDAIYHTATADVIHWPPPDRLDVGASVLDFAVAPGNGDTLRLVARASGRPSLLATWWSREGAGRLEEVPFVEAATRPTLTAVGRDDLVLTWSSVWMKPDAGGGATIGLVTVVSRRVRSCR